MMVRTQKKVRQSAADVGEKHCCLLPRWAVDGQELGLAEGEHTVAGSTGCHWFCVDVALNHPEEAVGMDSRCEVAVRKGDQNILAAPLVEAGLGGRDVGNIDRTPSTLTNS